MKKWLLPLFIVMVLVQLIVPVNMIASYYDTVKNGEEFTFSVQPIDPYDPFRGRFVYIRPTAGQEEYRLTTAGLVVASEEDYDYTKYYRKDKTAYAVITKDENGFARISEVLLEKPKDNVPYIKTKFRYSRLELPLDRYYMEETLAPEAERVVRDRELDAHITVRVRGGRAFITGLYVENMRIEDYLKK